MNKKLRKKIFHILDSYIKQKTRKKNRWISSKKKKQPGLKRTTSKRFVYDSIHSNINGRKRRGSRMYYNDGRKIYVKSNNNGLVKSYIIPKKMCNN